MRTFLEQKSDARQRIFELEEANRRMERQIDTNEAEIERLRYTLSQIGQPVEVKQ